MAEAEGRKRKSGGSKEEEEEEGRRELMELRLKRGKALQMKRDFCTECEELSMLQYFY